MFKHLRKPASDFWYVGTTHMTGNEAGRSEGKLSVYLAGSQEAAPPPPLGLGRPAGRAMCKFAQNVTTSTVFHQQGCCFVT